MRLCSGGRGRGRWLCRAAVVVVVVVWVGVFGALSVGGGGGWGRGRGRGFGVFGGVGDGAGVAGVAVRVVEGNAVVVASLRGDEVGWLVDGDGDGDGVLKGWERFVYVADGEAIGVEGGGNGGEEGREKKRKKGKKGRGRAIDGVGLKRELRIPKNKGREGMVYLRYVLHCAERIRRRDQRSGRFVGLSG